jgi:hypothetical protein
VASLAARRCGLYDGGAGRSGPLLVVDCRFEARRLSTALALCLGSATGVGRGGGSRCCSGKLPQSLTGFSVVAMVVVISRAAVEVSGARRRCFRWQGSVVAVLSIPPLRRASRSGQIVFRVGVIRRSRVMPSVLVSFVGLGCSRRRLWYFN